VSETALSGFRDWLEAALGPLAQYDEPAAATPPTDRFGDRGGALFVTFDPPVILTPGSGRLEGKRATLLYHRLMGIDADTMKTAIATITNWNEKPNAFGPPDA
jgi:hypothetical protein